eukprot:TRINITY_DN16822_c0_g1_i1.p1 TRINITY_DN16822_c0_g1~~TRINITY_DN16822_c0_g1_i1.p1  ORF type:complete len:488 (-),score=79.95 TRINITY_DN16822_c0_g1_i1:132-1595(-)
MSPDTQTLVTTLGASINNYYSDTANSSTIIRKTIDDISPDSLQAIATEFLHNDILSDAITAHLEDSGKDPNPTQNPVFKWLYAWYELGNIHTQRFVLRFIPTLVYLYLSNTVNGGGEIAATESLLVCIYNAELASREDKPVLFTPPSSNIPSYLSPRNQQTTTIRMDDFYSVNGNPSINSALTENALRRFNTQGNTVVVDGPLPVLNPLTVSTRALLIRVILQRFNDNITCMPPSALKSFCGMVSKICSSGFNFAYVPKSISSSKASVGKCDVAEMIPILDEVQSSTSSLSNLGLDSDDEGDGKKKADDKTFHAPFRQGRIIVVTNPIVAQELVRGLTACVFKRSAHEFAIEALRRLYLRASYDLVAEIMLSAGALLHEVCVEKIEGMIVQSTSNTSLNKADSEGSAELRPLRSLPLKIDTEPVTNLSVSPTIQNSPPQPIPILTVSGTNSSNGTQNNASPSKPRSPSTSEPSSPTTISQLLPPKVT